MQHHIETEDSDDEKAMEEDEEKEKDFQKDIAEMPVISNEGYYWLGKDYSNCYKQDFQNIEEFGKGKY